MVYRPIGQTRVNGLVMVRHDGSGLGLDIAEPGAHPLSVFRSIADTAGFLLVYPESSPDTQGNVGWNDFRNDDIGFFKSFNAKFTS